MNRIKLKGEDYGMLVSHFTTTPLKLQLPDVSILVEAVILEVVEKFNNKTFWPQKMSSTQLKISEAIALKIWLQNTEQPTNPYTLTLTIGLAEIVHKQISKEVHRWTPF